MAKSIKKKKVTKKKVGRELAKIKSEDKGLVFAGASRLMTPAITQQQKNERNLIIAVAKAIDISPLSVVILGNVPYIDNKGRKEKMESYKKGSSFEYNWVKRSETDIDKAICEARIVNGKKKLTPWIAGECSPASTKMNTLSGYQNHMAQTRAENRAFEHLYGLRLRNDLLVGLQKLMTGGQINESTAQRALEASKMSAEEYSGGKEDPIIGGIFKPEDRIVVTNLLSEKEADDLLMKAINSGFKDKTSAIAGINRLLKINIKELAQLTKSQAKSVEVALLQKKNAKK